MAITQFQESVLPQDLRHYILRGNVMVPLVPIDQLPYRLEGVPRQLTHRQISDQDWKFLRETIHLPTTLQIQAPGSLVHSSAALETKSQYLAPDHHVLKKPYASRAAISEDTKSLSDTFASVYRKDASRSGYRCPHPSGIVPDESKKEFCTHWIQTGSCAFTHIGCKYKHEMPAKEKLQELGFRHMPMWFKQKPGINTWMQGRLAASKHPDSHVEEMMTLRQFPDPATWRNKLTYEHDAQHKEDQVISTPEQRPATKEPEKLLSNTITPLESRDTVDALEGAFVEDLIDIHDDIDHPTSPQAATAVSPEDTEVSFGSISSSSQSSPVLSSPSGNMDSHGGSSEGALCGNNIENLNPELMVSHKESAGAHIPPDASNSKYSGTVRKPTHQFRVPSKHNGLAISKHASANIESSKCPEALGKSAACGTDQPARKDTRVMAKTDHTYRHHTKHGKKGVVKGVTKGATGGRGGVGN
ncbi:hypothetical protein DE146DRAFT_49885 [Phaeosphaeria sp. MPI-PUGE-AT-0046c]|nr:hypothetical protein DE146DRAFT_49885 [Phaeosphaeria sp. MPI-PUGE-AT-0046c]